MISRKIETDGTKTLVHTTADTRAIAHAATAVHLLADWGRQGARDLATALCDILDEMNKGTLLDESDKESPDGRAPLLRRQSPRLRCGSRPDESGRPSGEGPEA